MVKILLKVANKMTFLQFMIFRIHNFHETFNSIENTRIFEVATVCYYHSKRRDLTHINPISDIRWINLITFNLSIYIP